jgi:hypothetical protein
MIYKWILDRLCCLVVRDPGYRSRGPGSIPDATRFSEKVGLERGPLSFVNTIEGLLERKNSDSSLDNQSYGSRRSAALITRHYYIRKRLH